MKGMLILFLGCLILGCSPKKQSQNAPQGRIANISICASVRSLDPRVGNEFPSSTLIRMLYEGLMRVDSQGEIIPGIAESYEISEDQKRYIFHLRPSLWSNGEPVTAFDFEYTWKKAVDPQHAMTGSFTFYAIKNVEACLQGRVSVDEVGIKALDEYTLLVELEHPAPYFLSLITCSTFMPINKKVDMENHNWASSLADFVCNGPFKIEQWKKGDFILLHKNNNYWDQEHVALAGIHFHVIEDSMTAFYLFEKGKLDWYGAPFMGSLPSEILKDKKVRKKIHSHELFGVHWFFVNTERYPFNNKNLRKALAYAINRQSIADHVLQMEERPAMGILAKGLALQKEPYFEDGNEEKAREYFECALKELGLTKDEFPKVILSYKSSIISHRLNQAVQQQWHDVLGIEVELEQTEWPVHFTKLSKGDFEIGQMAWVSWINDPIYFLETFRMKSLATNMSRWENENYRHLLDLSDNEINKAKRDEFLREAEYFLMDEMPVIPICFMRSCHLQNPALKGVYTSPLLDIDFRWAYFEESQ